MTQHVFGIGGLFANRNDVVTPDPVQFGTIQDTALDLSFNIKELSGQYQAPVALARGSMKLTGKSKSAKINMQTFNDVFFGLTPTTGQQLTQLKEPGTVPGSSTYIVTVANSATYVADEGVTYALTGVKLTRVLAGSEATGKYSVNLGTGVYTFAVGDASAAVLISYAYTVTTGKKLVISNQLMGFQPEFSLLLTATFRQKTLNLQLNYAVSSKLSFGFKNEDFMIPEFDFQMGADDGGIIGTMWLSE